MIGAVLQKPGKQSPVMVTPVSNRRFGIDCRNGVLRCFTAALISLKRLKIGLLGACRTGLGKYSSEELHPVTV
jgi:hypothetical protein